ncbi:MAG: hypothetical protein ACQCN4_12250 [Candidatus Bathyarchaeia archaeon]|jgi:hypothetical protein
MSSASENASLGDLVRDLLLAMVYSQNEANSAFIAGIEELAATDVTIGYTRRGADGKDEKREIKGNALSFGVLPTLLNIQSSTIEVRTAISPSKNPQTDTKNPSGRSSYLFKTNLVDAKYQNAYSYKPETAGIVKITIVPTPPTEEMLDAIKAAASRAQITDKTKQ